MKGQDVARSRGYTNCEPRLVGQVAHVNPTKVHDGFLPNLTCSVRLDGAILPLFLPWLIWPWSLLSFLFSRNHSISPVFHCQSPTCYPATELEAMSLSCFNSALSACSRCSEWQQALQVAWWFMGLMIRGWWCDYVWLVVTPRLLSI